MQADLKVTRILVTGATGLLGSSLCSWLATHKKYRVIRVGFRKTADLQVDLTDRDSVVEALDQASPEFIINLAALTDVDKCEEDINLAYLANTKTVENLVSWLSIRRSVKLIHLSTDQVYDGIGPQCESEVVIRNAYALSKYAAEISANSVNACVLRTNFFGRSEVPGRASFSDWALSGLGSEPGINGFTDIYFSPLRIATLCSLIGLVVGRFSPGVFNLGSRGGMSKFDFLFRLASIFQKNTQKITPVTSDQAQLTSCRPKDMRMNSSLFEQTFGVRLPDLTVEIEGLRSEYEI